MKDKIKLFTKHIGDLVGQNKLEEAIKRLKYFLKNSPKLNEIILQSARYKDITDQIRMGVVDFENAELTLNKIRFSILSILDEIENNSSNSEIHKSLESFFLKDNLHHSISQQHSGIGDNVAGDKIIKK